MILSLYFFEALSGRVGMMKTVSRWRPMSTNAILKEETQDPPATMREYGCAFWLIVKRESH